MTVAAWVRESVTWARARPRVLAFAAAICVLMGALYFVSDLSILGDDAYDRYPFGSDVPAYSHNEGMPDIHLLKTVQLRVYRAVLDALGIAETPVWAKLPEMLLGLATLIMAMAAFSIANAKLSVRNIIYGACVGLALIVWYFASVPESYALTTALYTAYMLGLVVATRFGLSVPLIAAMSVVFFLCLYNDVSILFLTLVPAFMYGLRLATEKLPRLFVLAHVAGAGLYLADNIINRDSITRYLGFFLEYSPLDAQNHADNRTYDLDVVGSVMHFFFYSLAAPRDELTYAPWTSYPDYYGFFDPSPLNYFSGVVPALFLILYLGLFAFVRLSLVTRLVAGFAAFVGLRFALVMAFNPVEAILYASVAILPILFVLFHFLEKSNFRWKTAYAGAFALVLLAANTHFFF